MVPEDKNACHIEKSFRNENDTFKHVGINDKMEKGRMIVSKHITFKLNT